MNDGAAAGNKRTRGEKRKRKEKKGLTGEKGSGNITKHTAKAVRLIFENQTGNVNSKKKDKKSG